MANIESLAPSSLRLESTPRQLFPTQTLPQFLLVPSDNRVRRIVGPFYLFNMRITSEEDERPRFELFILGDDEKKVEWKDETRKPTLLCPSLTFIPTHLVPKAFRTPLPSSLIKKTTRSATYSRRASTNMTMSPSPHTKPHTRSSPSSKCAFPRMALSAPKTPSCARAEISCRIWRF